MGKFLSPYILPLSISPSSSPSGSFFHPHPFWAKEYKHVTRPAKEGTGKYIHSIICTYTHSHTHTHTHTHTYTHTYAQALPTYKYTVHNVCTHISSHQFSKWTHIIYTRQVGLKIVLYLSDIIWFISNCILKDITLIYCELTKTSCRETIN